MFWGKDETRINKLEHAQKDKKLLSGEEWLANARDKLPGGVQRMAWVQIIMEWPKGTYTIIFWRKNSMNKRLNVWDSA